VSLNGPTPAPVLLLTGPAGAGKTALADLYARTRLDRAVHLSLDDVRDRVRAGYANPEDGWNDLTQRQYDLARRSCALTARLYTADEYTCIIDDAVFPDWPQVSLQGWLDDLGDLTVGLVLVTARPQVLARRNATRSGHRRLDPATVQLIHDRMTGWHDHGIGAVDTSDLTLDEAVDALDELVVSGQAFRTPRLGHATAV
jgi:ribose 1,5-bisphosphokinase PhnN